VGALIQLSLNDLDEEIRIASLDEIVRLNPPGAVETYVKTLKDKNNVRLNLAGAALGQLGDASAVAPLIDALVTTHTIVIRPRKGRSKGATSVSFQKDGGGTSGGSNPVPEMGTTMTTGNRTKVIHKTVSNQDVLQSLVVLTGQSFGFNQAAWKHWYEAEKESEAVRL